jgi:hypothetical protein
MHATVTTWQKSSYSGSEGGTQCVELSRIGETVGVRDSKTPEAGHLVLSRETFRALVDQLRARA